MSREVKGVRSVVVVSDLDSEADEKEIAEYFEKYGRLDKVLVAKQRPWVALLYFEDRREAREAARCLDGTRMSGTRVTVELASGMPVRTKCESSKVYLYDLGNAASKREICEIFRVFGRLKHVWAENQRDEYVVIVYEMAHQAKDAVRNLDGTLINGRPVRVKLCSDQVNRDLQASSEEVFVGNLGSGTDVREIEETFTPFGALRSVWVSRNPEGCALVWFKDERDAREAVWCLDRRWMNDRQITVKLTRRGHKWCSWSPKNEGRTHNNSKDFKSVEDCKTPSRTFKVSYGFDCIYTKVCKDDQLNVSSMKSTAADDKSHHSKASKGTPSASSGSIDDWDGNKTEERIQNEGSARKRKSEYDKRLSQLETMSRFERLAQLLESRPRDDDHDDDAKELQCSKDTRSVFWADGGSTDKRTRNSKTKPKSKSSASEAAADKKKKLDKKKRKKSKTESHSPDDRSKSSTPSYECRSAGTDFNINSNITHDNNNNNNRNNINNNNNTSYNNNINTTNNIDNNHNNNNNNTSNSNNTSNNIDNNHNNNIDGNHSNNNNNNGDTDNSHINTCNNINNTENICKALEYPALESSPPVDDEIVSRPAEEPQNSPDEGYIPGGICEVEMSNAVVVATANASEMTSRDDNTLTVTTMTMATLPSMSSSVDPSVSGLPLVGVDQGSAGSRAPFGVCPPPSTIYIVHHHHYHHYHYHCLSQHHRVGDGYLVTTTESSQ